jgi:predicted small secreted protein
MKKLLVVLFASAILTACNNDGEGSSDVKDSVLEKIDSSADAKIDSLRDSTERLKEKVEETFEKTDSANRAIADTTKRRQ